MLHLQRQYKILLFSKWKTKLNFVQYGDIYLGHSLTKMSIILYRFFPWLIGQYFMIKEQINQERNNSSRDAHVLSRVFSPDVKQHSQVWKCTGTSTFHFWNTVQNLCINDRHRLEHGRTREFGKGIDQEEHYLFILWGKLFWSKLYKVVYLSGSSPPLIADWPRTMGRPTLKWAQSAFGCASCRRFATGMKPSDTLGWGLHLRLQACSATTP